MWTEDPSVSALDVVKWPCECVVRLRFCQRRRIVYSFRRTGITIAAAAATTAAITCWSPRTMESHSGMRAGPQARRAEMFSASHQRGGFMGGVGRAMAIGL